ncbi:MAG: lytic transglycosylase domain-containing protein [Clostridia bacterium]|nr:lytic transglycosylase domain-containing protein [Clostridia bacterium]
MSQAIKLFIYRCVAVVLVIGLSIGFGFAFDAVMVSVEKKEYPRPEAYGEYIQKYSAEYGIPEHIIYSIIKVESNFASDLVSDNGEIGLMQINADTFEWISRELLKEELESGMLYSPEINIRYGTYYISYLHGIYGVWDTCFAAYDAGIDTVNEWHTDASNVDENGTLIKYPQVTTDEYVKSVNEAIDNYTKLYY